MRNPVILILLFLTSWLAGTTTAEELDIDVMSFNIRYGTADDGRNRWDARRELVVDVMRQHAPDVIALQEALRFQLDEIGGSLPGYGEIGEGRNGEEEGEYSAVLYREDRFDVDAAGTFWLSDTPEVPSRHWGNVCTRICTWARLVDTKSDRGFYVYNTHLDHVSQPSREKSVRLIVDHIARRDHPDPFVLTGDFNAGEDNPAIRYLKGEDGGEAVTPLPLADAFRVLHPREQGVGTFNGFEGKTDGEKIDYILVPLATKVLSAEILRMERKGRYPSDHFPVNASLRLTYDPTPDN